MSIKNDQLAIGRTMKTVTLTITCSNEYAAMELYDSLVVAAVEGNVTLKINGTKIAPRADHA
jgi:hypothetical protein